MVDYSEWKVSKWYNIKVDTVKNKNHQLYEYVIKQQENGNQDKNDFTVNYFLINGVKITLDDLYSRYNPFYFGFDLDCKEYPKEINCFTDVLGVFKPLYCQLDEYGERLRIWGKK